MNPLLALALLLAAPAPAPHALALPPALTQLPQIPACKFVSAAVGTPCAARFAASSILPALIPLEAKGLHFSKTVLDEHNKAVVQRLQKFEAAGYKWLGKSDKHLIPNKVALEFDMGVAIDQLAVAPLAGASELKVTARGSAEIQITGVLQGADERDFKGKKFTVSFEVGGTLYLTNAPSGDECAKAPPDWSMLVLAFTFDELKSVSVAGARAGVRVPEFITDSPTFLSLVNWAVGHLYKNFDQFHTRGLPLCLTKGSDGRANCPADVQKQEHLVLRVGKGSSDVTVDFTHPGGKLPHLAVGNAEPLCGLASGVLADSCSGALVNALASSILPIRRAVPKELLGSDGVFVVAKSLQTATSAAGVIVSAKVALAKTGQPDFNLEAAGAIKVTPVCGQHSVALGLHAGLTELKGSPALPKWLLDGVGRTAVNLKLASHGPFEVPLPPRKIQRLELEVNTCAVARALLKTASTDAVANSVAASILPFDLPAAGAIAAVNVPAADRKLLRAADDLSLVIKSVELKKGAGHNQKVRVVVQLRKARQSEVLTGEASFNVSAKAECGAGRNVLVLRPRVDELQAGKLPAWVLGSTVLDLVNAALSDEQHICAVGDCAK